MANEHCNAANIASRRRNNQDNQIADKTTLKGYLTPWVPQSSSPSEAADATIVDESDLGHSLGQQGVRAAVHGQVCEAAEVDDCPGSQEQQQGPARIGHADAGGEHPYLQVSNADNF